jgi:apolipoprotein N-acyltransferase
VGWVAALIAGSLALLWMGLCRKGVAGTGQRIVLPLCAAALLCRRRGLRLVQWTAPQGQPITVRLLQGNIPQEMKFSNDAWSPRWACMNR